MYIQQYCNDDFPIGCVLPDRSSIRTNLYIISLCSTLSTYIFDPTCLSCRCSQPQDDFVVVAVNIIIAIVVVAIYDGVWDGTEDFCCCGRRRNAINVNRITPDYNYNMNYQSSNTTSTEWPHSQHRRNQ
mmetsp:Transcript_18973/g.20431  ORF Transcript_18973/g.20431 Transcript_18973/m.20431 type:complete len:129 (+) Transcript_18973:194-580(+)